MKQVKNIETPVVGSELSVKVSIQDMNLKAIRKRYLSVKEIHRKRQIAEKKPGFCPIDWPPVDDELAQAKNDYNKAHREQRVRYEPIIRDVRKSEIKDLEFVIKVYNSYENGSVPKTVALEKLLDIYKEILSEEDSFEVVLGWHKKAPSSKKVKDLILSRLLALSKSRDQFNKVVKISSGKIHTKAKSKVQAIDKQNRKYKNSIGGNSTVITRIEVE